MRGGLIQRGPGRWSAVIYIGKGLDGKKKCREFLPKWLASIKPPRVGPRTHERYTEIVENHLIGARVNSRLADSSEYNWTRPHVQRRVAGRSAAVRLGRGRETVCESPTSSGPTRSFTD